MVKVKIINNSSREIPQELTEEMISRASEFTIRKKNVGIQENRKYPREYRDKINQRFLKILNQILTIQKLI